LRDRKHLGEDGIIVIVAVVNSYDNTIASPPDIVTRGFVYVKESEELMADLKQTALDSICDSLDMGNTDWAQIKNRLRDDVNHLIYNKTKRRPMVLPVIITL
jgi:ribonuclease J